MNAFILKDKIYSFKKADVDVYIKTCKLLDTSIMKLTQKVAEGDLESLVALMYCSLRDSKGMSFEEFKKMNCDEYGLLVNLLREVNQ